jgi:hypothetical protein
MLHISDHRVAQLKTEISRMTVMRGGIRILEAPFGRVTWIQLAAPPYVGSLRGRTLICPPAASVALLEYTCRVTACVPRLTSAI